MEFRPSESIQKQVFAVQNTQQTGILKKKQPKGFLPCQGLIYVLAFKPSLIDTILSRIQVRNVHKDYYTL